MIEVMANNGNKYKRINEIGVILTFKDKIMSKWWRKKVDLHQLSRKLSKLQQTTTPRGINVERMCIFHLVPFLYKFGSGKV